MTNTRQDCGSKTTQLKRKLAASPSKIVKHAACQVPHLATFQDMHSDDAAAPRAHQCGLACQGILPTSTTVHAYVESSQDEIPAANPPAMADQQPTYHPRDALHNTGSAMLQTTLVGAVVAGVQNTLRKQNVGAMGIITKSGGILALFGAQLANW